MSIQQSVNQALQSGIYAAGIGKGLANQKQIIQQKAEADAKIIQQAEEIGRLREQIAQLKQRLQKSADAASTERTAIVG